MRQFIKGIGPVLLNNVLPIALGVAVLILVILALVGTININIGLAEKIDPGRVEVAVEKAPEDAQTFEVHEVYKDSYEWVIGTFRAGDRTQVSSQYPGTVRIERVHVRARSTVEKKDLLVELDSRIAKAQLDQAKANLLQAQESETKAADELTRLERARASYPDAVTDAEMTRAKANLGSARAAVLQAKSGVAESSARLDDTEVRAPIDGIVVSRLREEGDTVRQGEPLLELYDVRSLRLEAPVREGLAGSLAEGQKLTIFVNALREEFEGTVEEIVPQADTASRSVLVKVSLPYTKGLLERGLAENASGRLKVPAGKRPHLCLAEAAVYTIGQNEFVKVVREVEREDGTTEKILEKRFVRTGQRGYPGRIEVLSGLDVGDRVLVPECDEEKPCPPAAKGPAASQ
jgi:RND family efflux transporter MFP subunit